MPARMSRFRRAAARTAEGGVAPDAMTRAPNGTGHRWTIACRTVLGDRRITFAGRWTDRRDQQAHENARTNRPHPPGGDGARPRGGRAPPHSRATPGADPAPRRTAAPAAAILMSLPSDTVRPPVPDDRHRRPGTRRPPGTAMRHANPTDDNSARRLSGIRRGAAPRPWHDPSPTSHAAPWGRRPTAFHSSHTGLQRARNTSRHDNEIAVTFHLADSARGARNRADPMCSRDQRRLSREVTRIRSLWIHTSEYSIARPSSR